MVSFSATLASYPYLKLFRKLILVRFLAAVCERLTEDLVVRCSVSIYILLPVVTTFSMVVLGVADLVLLSISGVFGKMHWDQCFDERFK